MGNVRIHPFPAMNSTGQPETHYAVIDGNGYIIAICNYESSAILVRDDAQKRAERSEQ